MVFVLWIRCLDSILKAVFGRKTERKALVFGAWGWGLSKTGNPSSHVELLDLTQTASFFRSSKLWLLESFYSLTLMADYQYDLVSAEGGIDLYEEAGPKRHRVVGGVQIWYKNPIFYLLLIFGVGA